MKKIMLILFLMAVLVCSAVDAETYKGSYKLETEINISAFKRAYIIMNRNIRNTRATRNKVYTSLNDVLNYAVIDNQGNVIPGGFKIKGVIDGLYYSKGMTVYDIEIKYTKLKDTCSVAPSEPKNINTSTACAKLLVDTNGFSNGSNKSIRDTKTLQPKDQFTLLLYSDSVKAEPNSIEDILLYDVIL